MSPAKASEKIVNDRVVSEERLNAYHDTIDNLIAAQDKIEGDHVGALLSQFDETRRQINEDLLALTDPSTDAYQQYQLTQLRTVIDENADKMREIVTPLLNQGIEFSYYGGENVPVDALKALDIDLQMSNPLPEARVPLIVIKQSAGDLILDVTNGFVTDARRILAQGVTGRANPDAVIADITELLRTQQGRDDETRFGKVTYQAERIVRTEMGAAFAIGNQVKQQQMAKALPGLKKYWLALADDRTREEHLLASDAYSPGGDPGPIPFDEPFEVGGEELLFPHDPNGSADNVINCRCVCVPYAEDWFGNDAPDALNDDGETIDDSGDTLDDTGNAGFADNSGDNVDPSAPDEADMTDLSLEESVITLELIAMRAERAAERAEKALRDVFVLREHYPGQHDQKAHGHLGSVKLFKEVLQKGGFTYRPVNGSSPKSGYALSIFQEYEHATPDTKFTPQVVAQFLRDVKGKLQQDTRTYLGGWHDTEKGMVYLDLSLIEADKETAIKLAKEHNQEGIYDLASGQTIITKEDDARRLVAATIPFVGQGDETFSRTIIDYDLSSIDFEDDVALGHAARLLYGVLCRAFGLDEVSAILERSIGDFEKVAGADGHWVTLPNGVHVLLDGSGQIVLGPNHMIGANVDHLDERPQLPLGMNALVATFPDARKAIEIAKTFPPLGAKPTQEQIDAAKTYLDSLPQREGHAVGCPPNINTPEDLAQFRNDLVAQIKEGESARYWYEESGKAVIDAFGGDKVQAEKFVQLLAIFSPHNSVASNTQQALRAYAQYVAGAPIDAGGLGFANKNADALLYHDEDWVGRKTNNFYQNLMPEVNGDTAQKLDGSTIDIWMIRAAGFPPTTTQPSEQQYSFLAKEVALAADTHNQTQLKAGDPPITPHEAQAAVWVSEQARSQVIKSGGKADLDAVIADSAQHTYAGYLRQYAAQVHLDVAPSDGKVAEAYRAAPLADQMRYQAGVRAAFQDARGLDVAARELSVPSGQTFDAGHGITVAALPAAEAQQTKGGEPIAGASGTVEASQEQHISGYAALRGLVLGQSSVAWARAFPADTKGDANAVSLDLGRPLNDTEVASLTAHLGGHEVMPTSSGAWIYNKGDTSSKGNIAFQRGVTKALKNATLSPDITRVEQNPVIIHRTKIEGGANGNGYRAAILKDGRPDVYARLENYLSGRVRRAQEDFLASQGI